MAAARRITFGHIYIREYARSFGGESSSPCDPHGDVQFPLGLSDAVLVHDERGQFVQAEDIFTGAVLPVLVPPSRPGHKGKGGGPRSRSGSLCTDPEGGAAAAAAAAAAASSSSTGGGGSGGGSSSSSSSSSSSRADRHSFEREHVMRVFLQLHGLQM